MSIGPETIAIRPGVTANSTRHLVARDGVEVFLSPQLFKIFLLVSRARFGATPTQLFNLLYADSIDGGPLTGRKAVQVQRCQPQSQTRAARAAHQVGGIRIPRSRVRIRNS